MLSRRSVLVPGVLGLVLIAGACKEEEEPPRLFDEDGVWSLVRYDLEGNGDLSEIDTMNRRDAFMLSFDRTNRVVTTASCGEDENDTPASSTCLLTPTTTQWNCSCYGYDFVRDEMLWKQFTAGDIPPEVSLTDLDEPAAGDSGTGDGGASSDAGTLIIVAEIPDIASTYNFRPLPLDLFGSMESSRFVFQARAGSVFDRVFDDPDGRPTCEPCLD